MKRVLLMLSACLFPQLLAAQDANIDSLLGEHWYGLYMNGQKSGYARTGISKEGNGYTVEEDVKFQLNMVGVKQDMHTYTNRFYGPDGTLVRIVSFIQDPVSKTEFEGEVTGDDLILKSTVFGQTTKSTLPKPNESIDDAARHAEWVLGQPSIGDTMSFSVFEPLYKKEIVGVSYILAIETRTFGGVPTKVYKIKTSLDFMNIDSVTYVAEDGTTLEDLVAGMLTMRLEPEEIAKDVQYNNDVIVSNAALLGAPIEKPRTRDTLRLLIHGPISEDHLFNDERQFIKPEGDAFLFESRRIATDDFEQAHIPIQDEELERWIKPTTFVQSGDPRLIAKAKEIIGDETNAYAISKKLCDWVFENVESTFSARLTNALEVLESMQGDCTEHSILYIGLARAAGLPAREVAGLIYVDDGQPGFYFHQWAKVWVGKWIDVDPTFDEPLADVTHIKLTEGDLYRQARIIPLIGKLNIEVAPEAPDAEAAKQ